MISIKISLYFECVACPYLTIYSQSPHFLNHYHIDQIMKVKKIFLSKFLDMLCSQALKRQIQLPGEDLRNQILYLEAVKVEGIIQTSF